MKAIVVRPRQTDTIHMRDMPDPEDEPDQVAVKMLRVGLCGTDAEIDHGLYGKPPDGEEFLILGHENFGVVEDVGARVKGFEAGDFVVSTVRRPCGSAASARRARTTCAAAGRYTERGIMRRHGFMAQDHVESPRFLNKIPKAMRDIGVLLEPMSIVEKGIDHAFCCSAGWCGSPKTAWCSARAGRVARGGGAAGARDCARPWSSREDPDRSRGRSIVRELGAEYASTANRTLADVRARPAPRHPRSRRAGNASVAFDAMQILGAQRRAVPAQRHGGETIRHAVADRPDQPSLVLGNQVVFGSVNANPRHFDDGHQGLLAASRRSIPACLQAPDPSHPVGGLQTLVH